jgi:hypothetical protein
VHTASRTALARTNPPRLLAHRHLVALAATALIIAACETASPTDTTPPGPVTSLTATASDAAVTLTWTDPTAADLSVIRITRTPGGTPAEVAAGVETYTASGLTNGTQYSFSLVAVDAAGNASTAVVATATPPGTSASCANPIDLLDADVDDGVTLVSGSCYRVSSAITVSGGTLTIPSDVIVEFTDTGSLVVAVGAALAANGTAGSPVIFRGTEAIKGFWRGIRIQSESLSNVLNHVVVRDAGASAWSGNTSHVAALWMAEGRVAITHSTFTNNAGNGIQAFGNATLQAFSDNLFYANDVPMWLHPDRVGEIDDTSSFSDGGVENVGQYVKVTFGNNDAVTTAQTWPALEVPYRVTDRTFVGAPLTVAPGTVVEFDQGTSLIANTGTLNLSGTAADPIVLRGVEAIRGHWQGVRIMTDSPQNVFEHVVVRDAGASPWSGATTHVAALYMAEGRVAITHSTFTNNAGTGIQAFGNATFEAFGDNLFYANEAPMWLYPDRVGEIDGTSSFSDGGVPNDDQFVRVTFGNNDYVSTTQTWPALTVPYRVTTRTFVRAPLTIAAGARLEFAQGVEFIVADAVGSFSAGSLTLAGTEPNRVVLAGAEDLSGYWIGVFIETASASNVFSYATISNGGAPSSLEEANVEVLNGTLALQGNVEVTDSGGYGIYLTGSSLTGCPVLTGSNNLDGLIGSSTSSTDCPPP